MTVFVVVEIKKDNPPALIGVFKDKIQAEKAAYSDVKKWCNIIPTKLL